MAAGSRLFSSTSRRTAGDSGMPVAADAAAAAAGEGAGVAGAGVAGADFAGADFAGASGAGAAGAAPSFSMARLAPTSTVAPSAARISPSVPAAGAGTSSVTLSVSSSTTGSSAATASPVVLIQRATVASATDSPRVGTVISIAMTASSPRVLGRSCPPVSSMRAATAAASPQSFFALKPSASFTRAACSRLCRDRDPVAGDAAAARPA